MDVLTEDMRDGSLMELLYEDNLPFCVGSLDEVMDKYGQWKNVVEAKALRMNVGNTKCMQLLFGKESIVLKLDLCDVCSEWVVCDSI